MFNDILKSGWSRWQRLTYLAFLVGFGLLIIFVLASHWLGLEYFIGWSIVAEGGRVNVPIEAFKLGVFTISTEAENPIFYQRFSGEFPEISLWSYYSFFGITMLCITLLLAIITTLKRFWYFVGISIFVVFLVNFKLEILLLMESTSKIGLIVALIAYLPITFYFNSFAKNLSLGWRWLILSCITLALGVFIYFTSGVAAPFFYMATYGFIGPFVLTLIFILMVAHEIIGFFVYILTRSAKGTGGSNFGHLMTIVAIYLLNLIMAYLYESNVIDWDFLYIDLFLLLAISSVIGIWGFRMREPQYDFLFPYKPIGALAFISLAVVAFSTIAHLHNTGQDAGIEVIRDFIIYGHLGYGIIFTVYILSNFVTPLVNSMPVYKVLYKPTRMPYFTFRLAGLIAFYALVAKSNIDVPLNQSAATYYNGLGDLYTYTSQDGIAQHYYFEGSIFALNNHKSNYTLAALAHSKREIDKAIEYYEGAGGKNSIPQDFVNLSNIYSDQDRFFDALFVLQEGIKKHPKSGEIKNNLGIVYSQSSVLDSAVYYIDEAYKSGEVNAAAGSNMLAVLAKNDIQIDIDSLKEAYGIVEDVISVNNVLVQHNLQGKPFGETINLNDSTLTYPEVATAYNFAYNWLYRTDTLDSRVIEQIENWTEDADQQSDIQLVTALTHYANGNVNKAFRKLNWQANITPSRTGRYFLLIGKWALMQGAYDVAQQYFEWAHDREEPKALFYLAVANSEQNNIVMADSTWSALLESNDRNEQIVANTMLQLLNLQQNDLETDNQKNLYLRYVVDPADSVQFNSVLNTINDANIKGEAILRQARYFQEMGQLESAAKAYQQIVGLNLSDPQLYKELQFLELDLLAEQRNIRGLATKINADSIVFGEDERLRKAYYTGLIAAYSGDTTKAKASFTWVTSRNPFYEQACIDAALYFNTINKFEAYHILLDALEINPKSVRLLKAYILQCARIQQETYAEFSFETLQDLIPKDEFASFREVYKEELKRVREEVESELD